MKELWATSDSIDVKKLLLLLMRKNRERIDQGHRLEVVEPDSEPGSERQRTSYIEGVLEPGTQVSLKRDPDYKHAAITVTAGGTIDEVRVVRDEEYNKVAIRYSELIGELGGSNATLETFCAKNFF